MQKFYTLKQIETPRLIIRPVQLGDEIQLNKAVNNSLVSLQEWMPWANDPSLETTRDFIQKGVFARASQAILDFPMVVIHKEDQKIISASGYNERSDSTQGLYEIGYWCDIDYKSKGYATEYVNALTRYALSQLEANTVVIRMEVDNVKSIAVAERLNFINQGTKPSTTKENATDYYFTCENLENLPPLEVSWTYQENDNSDAKMIAWAKKELQIKHEKAFSGSKVIVKTPWSSVLEINTGTELFYLKQTPQDLFLEAEIAKLLHDKCGITDIPEMIASNPDCHCFIMKKCGDLTLRDYFAGNLNFELLIQSIDGYKKLQKATIDVVDDLIALGVPDWRLDKFPALYDKLISNANFLKENGLVSNQQSKLHSYSHRVKELCDQLASYAIPECLNHSDFHDNNILYDKTSKSTAIIDLGETAINHPFFSIIACLGAAKNRYALSDESENHKSLEDNALSGWLDDQKYLNESLEIVKILHPVYLLFAQKRFLDAINLPYDAEDPVSVKQHDKINKGFTWFIDNMEAAYGE